MGFLCLIYASYLGECVCVYVFPMSNQRLQLFLLYTDSEWKMTDMWPLERDIFKMNLYVWYLKPGFTNRILNLSQLVSFLIWRRLKLAVLFLNVAQTLIPIRSVALRLDWSLSQLCKLTGQWCIVLHLVSPPTLHSCAGNKGQSS